MQHQDKSSLPEIGTPGPGMRQFILRDQDGNEYLVNATDHETANDVLGYWIAQQPATQAPNICDHFISIERP